MPPARAAMNLLIYSGLYELRSARISNFGALPTKLSEAGAEIALTKTADASLDELQGCPIILYLEDEALTLQGAITQWSHTEEEFPKITVRFAELSQPQHRRLVELLYCRPGQWKSRRAPNELHSLWLILKSVFKPKVVF